MNKLRGLPDGVRGHALQPEQLQRDHAACNDENDCVAYANCSACCP